ncbi:restriction endonuclease [Salidesulfovibrio brasiliensis]|uniref:restriction endonuclease n=1 Tax=Salidesulfovibrio brasiliensis TaxID=221711 RepID=UPI0006CF9FA9|nr:restriction endonuclease [Salidesulfovibrio brasiliensis]
MVNTGKEFEDHIHYIYDMLLNMKDEGVVVEKNIKLETKLGRKHQIDVYYEFSRAGITHRVAIECKNEKRPIEKGEVIEFHGKIRDVGDITGVMVSTSGYQSGALEFAEDHDILSLTPQDLPSIGLLLGGRIMAVAGPGESNIGQPFWAIMELRDGINTGTYYALPTPGGGIHIPLFFSKKHAGMMIESLGPTSQRWTAVGLEQHNLRAFILTLNGFSWQTMLYWQPPWGMGDALPDGAEQGLIRIPIDAEQLEKDYYLGEVPYIKPLSEY